MKILIAKRRALGDTVLLSSTAELLASVFPEAEISALVPGVFAPVLAGHPRLKKIYAYEEGWLSLLPALRRERFDHFFQFHSSPHKPFLARLSGAGAVHFSVQNRVTEKAYGKHPNALEWDAFFLRSVLGPQIELPAPEPRIHLSGEERAHGQEFWRRQGVEGQRVVFLGLGASRPAKRWPAAHFARLAELLRDRCELVPAIITGPGEAEARFGGEVIDQLRARGMRPLLGAKGDFLHAAGLGLRALAGAISACRAYVGNDSGPKHIAVAVGIPTFTFFGPEDPEEWHPYDKARHPVFFRPGLACRREDNGRWCGLEVCSVEGREHHQCMADIDPLDVLAEFRRVTGA